MAMASISSPFSARMQGHESEDFTGEDFAFLGMSSSSSSQPFDAQMALNELGLQPSPPKARRYLDSDRDIDDDYGDDDDDGNDHIPFDLDRELEMEEEQRMEEEDVPDDLQDDEDDEILESNGILQRPATTSTKEVLESLPPAREVLDSPPLDPVAKGKVNTVDSLPVTSKSYAPIATRTPPLVVEGIDEDLGINGLPKYIPAGTATATLLDGSTIRFEKKRRMRGWKVSL